MNGTPTHSSIRGSGLGPRWPWPRHRTFPRDRAHVAGGVVGGYGGRTIAAADNLRECLDYAATPMGALAHNDPLPCTRRDDWSMLLSQIEHGDQAALGRLYDQSVAQVYRLAHRITHNAADAEDVTCEVFQEVWRHAALYDARRGGAIQWLMSIAHHRAIDLYRKRAAQRALVDSAKLEPNLRDCTSSPEDAALELERSTLIQAALGSLSAMQAHLIGLSFFEGLSHREIATREHLPLGTVKSHLFRAMLEFRSLLSNVRPAPALGARR